ncbi:hypothetical protein BHE90_002164 [Fusarium euwallaceae]|uniref:AAA+ ATPase domain-containing protein n=1 Tax=Fusarium euwallaceae TaxID=1147111 RepID=A0A430M652_9HYPO|nr:hypothetical protein BHE90_002164 [Fusarium euwallaceae]
MQGNNDGFMSKIEESVLSEDSLLFQVPVGKESTRSEQAPKQRDEVVNGNEDELGGKAEIRHLYDTKEKSVAGETIYSTKVPITSGVQQRFDRGLGGRDEARDVAILHYHNATLQTDCIVVQSPELKRCLADILSGCVNIDIAAPSVELRPPFTGLAQRWDRLLLAEKTADNEKSKRLLQLLREILETELCGSFQAFQEFRKTGYTTFPNILVAFVPGEIVLRSEDGELSAGILKEASIEKEFMGGLVCILRVQVLDWNGKSFGYREKTWKIESFQGFRKATDLDAFPLQAHPEQGKVKQRLIDRGRAFEALCGQHVRNYHGLVHLESGWERKTIFISERIIVDANAFYRFQHYSAPDLSELESEEGEQEIDSPDTPGGSHARSQQQTTLTEKQCMLAVPRAKGFALNMKKWFEFTVSDITPITWNEKLLGNLVIPDEEKQLLLALVAHTAKEEDGGFDDFIEGKGKGLILLLAGPPGVGKTLTAESIAEELKRPLYRVGAGDLGLSADAVESSLQEAFRRCSHWNAVLLIDEADVFLEKRSSDRLAQNELVSVFLTSLEYYQGVLILTTNRTEEIDPAFESRIDIILTYDHLSQDARKQVWSNFVSRLPPDSVDLSEADLNSLSGWNINGRQIKSAIKTARIMAANERAPLGVRHLDIVLNIRRRGSKVLA